MVIRNLSRKSRSFRQLLSYMVQGNDGAVFIAHNLNPSSKNVRQIAREFYRNARFCKARKNGIFLYHEVLSFDPRDSQLVTDSALHDLTLKYLQLRAPQAKAVAVVHRDTDCSHVHLMISANEAGSSKKIHTSRQRFFEIRRELEAFQKDRYPELEHSIVFEGKQKRKEVALEPALSQAELHKNGQLEKERGRQVSRKNEIQQTFIKCLERADSMKEMQIMLSNSDLQLYRRGKTLGLHDLRSQKEGKPKAYRLKTLGLVDHYLERKQHWERKKTLERSTNDSPSIRELEEPGGLDLSR